MWKDLFQWTKLILVWIWKEKCMKMHKDRFMWHATMFIVEKTNMGEVDKIQANVFTLHLKNKVLVKKKQNKTKKFYVTTF